MVDLTMNVKICQIKRDGGTIIIIIIEGQRTSYI